MNKRNDTRTAILNEALDLASELGLEGLTIGTLARRVDMSKSGLYAHFESKEALQIQVLDAAAELFTAEVLRPALQAPRGRARLQTLFDRWVAWSSDAYSGGCPFIAAATELDDQDGPVRETLVRHLQTAQGMVGTIAEAGIEAGQFRADLQIEQFVFEFWGILLSFHHFSRLMRRTDASALAHRSFTRLLDAASA